MSNRILITLLPMVQVQCEKAMYLSHVSDLTGGTDHFELHLDLFLPVMVIANTLHRC